MIAPHREPEEDRGTMMSTPQVRRARRAVAHVLIGEDDTPPPSRVPGWQAWLVTAWIVGATAAYLLHMTGLWR